MSRGQVTIQTLAVTAASALVALVSYAGNAYIVRTDARLERMEQLQGEHGRELARAGPQYTEILRRLERIESKVDRR